MTIHPDFEALSSSLDGEDEAAAAHAANCPACQARLAELISVRDALGAPLPPPDPAVIDAAVARAMAEFEPAGASTPPAPGGNGHAPEAPVPVVGGRWRLWLTGSAAAAVLAVVVLAAVLVSGGNGTRDDETALSAGSAPESATETAPPSARAESSATSQSNTGTSTAANLPVQELGDVPDLATLSARLVTRREVAAASPAAADTATPGPAVVGTRVCEIEARTARPALGVVVAVANLRFQGTPAVALGFAPAPGATPVTLLVLAPQEACRLLAETTIP